MSKNAKPPVTLLGRHLPGITKAKGLGSPVAKTTTPQAEPPMAATAPTTSVQSPVLTGPLGFSIEACVPGAVVRVPLRMIDPNPLSPRRNYSSEVVDKIADSLPTEQFDAAHGYVENGRVKLIDGGTRWLAARDTGTPTLDVKFEKPPESKLALYNRARELNENRSETTALDYALSLRELLEQGAVKTQKDLLTAVKGPHGKEPLTEATLSKYLRISRLPAVVQRHMTTDEGCSTQAALYEVSALFTEGMSEVDLTARTNLALEIVDEIKARRLNYRQIEALVKSKLDGPKSRERSITHPLSIGSYKGAIKTFAKKGRFELQLNGLEAEKLDLLHTEIEAVIKKHLQQ